MPSKKRKNKTNARAGRVPATRSTPQIQSNNLFESLADTEFLDDEFNADLPERFVGISRAKNSSSARDNISSSGPPQLNADIQEYYALGKKPVTGGDWLEKPEIPLPSEILREQTGSPGSERSTLIDTDDTIRPHKIEGEYENNEDYLRTKYELLREDAIRPLREAVNEVREDPYKDEAEYRNKSIGVYHPVYITALVFSPRGLATRVAFSLSRVKKHIRWEQSKRLITGTLVALSPANDAFKTRCILATVAARPISALGQNPPEIDLFFARSEEQEIDPMTKWIMVECRTSYFEASRHILNALQHMMREPFPLSEHLVKVQKRVDPPAYIQQDPYLKLQSLVSIEESQDWKNVNVLEEWPAASSNSLDTSQGRALKRMLTKKLAIVQGPPGTGKTFVSVKALQILCDNLRKSDAPIIVTAQTNHAVDQILRHTMVFEPNFVRLGGRSKDANIKKRTLFELRSEAAPQKMPGSQRTKAAAAIRQIGKTLQKLLLPMEANKPPLDHQELLKLRIITEDQANSLVMDPDYSMGISIAENPSITMEQWLGRCLTPRIRPIQPDEYGPEFQEEDFEVEQLQEAEAEAVQDDDDIEALRGDVMLLCDNYRGKGASLTNKEIEDLLERTTDLTVIPNNERGAIYNYFLKEVKKSLVVEVRRLAKEYEGLVQARKVGMWNEDLRFLSEARIVGCTTTGLSKYRALISAVKPRVVLVEEAAETQESPVTAACFPSLEHLILVGDHLQLRPHTQVHDFEDEPYFLNLSLFERLVNNDVEFDTLMRQRRMIPEIRRLLYPIYDNTLKDHESVKDSKNRPPIEGMGGNNTFFFCHEWPEDRDSNMSAFNEIEAEMVVQFFDYLVLNGMDHSAITVLTFYNGQRKSIMKKIREHQNLRCNPNVNVVTVDSYQGEENEVVLLSLVRSNKKGGIGFLASDNRACVALSRAKRGFYIFGNAELMAIQSGTWAAVVDIMHGNKKFKVTEGQPRRLGYNLPLQCSNHGRKLWLPKPEDFDFIHGGCDLKCEGVLPCQHKCLYRCHPFGHDLVNCTQKCTKIVESCGHRCSASCCSPCRCQTCDLRSNGVKSMLKPKAHDTRSSKPQRSNRRTSSANRSSQAQTRQPQSSNDLSEWQSYATGGAQADDARMLRKKKEQDAQFLENSNYNRNDSSSFSSPSSRPARLIDVSPERRGGGVAGPKDENLLIEFDDVFESPHSPAPRVSRDVSYADVASSSERKSTGHGSGKGNGMGDFGLLD